MFYRRMIDPQKSTQNKGEQQPHRISRNLRIKIHCNELRKVHYGCKHPPIPLVRSEADKTKVQEYEVHNLI